MTLQIIQAKLAVFCFDDSVGEPMRETLQQNIAEDTILETAGAGLMAARRFFLFDMFVGGFSPDTSATVSNR
ncbi:MAG TPA: hypothetical protein VJ955_08485 [Desulfuromonadales bacterium]|nr:hypothetical protein [Desulfuromonadales bacterium]